MSLTCSHLKRNIIFLIVTSFLFAEDPFPDFGSVASFQSDLKSAALISNIPSLSGADHFLGLRSTLSILGGGADINSIIPGARLSIYPNPGYNIWAQVAKWNATIPSFSVGTGIQIQFPADNPNVNRAIGLGWNKVYGGSYIQRDISVHALYGRAHKTFDFGFIAVLDMHHVLIDDDKGIADYDKSINQIIPYVSWMVMDLTRISLSVPFDSKGTAIDFNCEFRFGKRE